MTEATNKAVEAINTTPSQFAVFKGKSAMRMQIQAPQEKYKTGCVFLQLAPLKEVKGDIRIFNWEDAKISIKLGVNDITSIVYGLAAGLPSIAMFHEFNGSTKQISFTANSSEGGAAYFLQATENNNGTKNSVSVPLTSPEVYGIKLMLEAALPIIHNWI